MSPAATHTAALDALPAAPPALKRLLQGADEIRTSRQVMKALAGDRAVAATYVKIARQLLPGRRVSTAGDAAPLLGDVASLRVAYLAAGARWLRALAQGSPLAAQLVRHSVATAAAAEPLGRDSGIVDPLHAYCAGLLHHIGDAAALAIGATRGGSGPDLRAFEFAAELLRAACAPAPMVNALIEYGAYLAGSSAALSVECRILAAADHVATALGFSAPLGCAAPRADASLDEIARPLLESCRRLYAGVEEVMEAAVDQAGRPDRPATAASSVPSLSPAVMPDVLEGVSSRDLGPIPALFARIAQAHDAEAVQVAVTAGIVEELDVARAAFLVAGADGIFKGGILCSRGTVPLNLHEFKMPKDQLAPPVRMALATGRPILHEGAVPGLEFLTGDQVAMTYVVPVIAEKDVLGVVTIEIEDERSVLPDLLAAVSAYAGLALQAVNFRRLSDEAKTDQLTGLLNRRGILDVLDGLLAAERDPPDELSIALIDCDHLKKVNDNFGHLMGDEFVRRISEVVRRQLRGTDHIGRYGGDEFLAILPGANFETTKQAMERARAQVELAGLESEDGLLLSISIGAVVRGNSGASRERLMKMADYALYRVKEMGRNSIEVLHANEPPAGLSM